MSKETNTVTFEVKGLGHFTAYKEEPVEPFWMDRRREIAKILGGRDELIKLERLHGQYAESKDMNDRDLATAAFLEIKRASMFVELKTVLIKTPDNFEVDSLSTEEYDKLWMALEAARGKFRSRDTGKSEADTGTSETGTRKRADTK